MVLISFYFLLFYTDERIRVGRDYQAIVPDLVPMQGWFTKSHILYSNIFTGLFINFLCSINCSLHISFDRSESRVVCSSR